MLKRFITSLFCLFLIFASSLSFVFADTGTSSLPSGYNPANTDYDLATSFNDYVKSRNANFSGTLPDAANIYILNLMNKGAQRLNTNIDNIKNAIAKKSETGGRVIWYLDSTVTNFYNDLFEFLLQDLELDVGDTANETVYSGRMYLDADGYYCFVYTTDKNPNSNNRYTVREQGTPYRFTNQQLVNNGVRSYDFHFPNQSNTFHTTYTSYRYYFGDTNKATLTDSQSTTAYNGNVCIYTTYNALNSYKFGVYLEDTNDIKFISTITPPSLNDNNVTVIFSTTENKTINNNNYQGDTYITNEGDVVNNYNPYPDPVTPGGNDPGWNVGGGQGSYNDGNGNNYTINFPDFELPDLNIDWSIKGLGNKFPFSIPFDIAALVSVLNAEPEAPRFQGTVNFGFTTWDYDINLQQFDSVAQACRIAELLLLVFGLILITRSIIKG